MLLSATKRAYFCKSIAIEMGGVSRYFSKVSGSGVDVTLLNVEKKGSKTHPPASCVCDAQRPLDRGLVISLTETSTHWGRNIT